MNVLEKILEEIKERIKKLKEADNMCRVNAERNKNFESVKYFQSLMFATERAESIIGDIIRSHMDDSDDDWIPCSKRLPEKNVEELYDMQLVTLKDGEVCLGVYRNEDDEWWTRKQEGERVYTNTHEVIAWKPLPEPYRAADKPDWKENMLNTFLAGH